MKRIIISDLHIGSRFYKGKELLSFLKTEDFDQLILAGDVIDIIKIPTFTKRCVEILTTIGNEKDVIYIIGNHDESMQGFIGTPLKNVRFCTKYEFTEDGRKFRIEHGHGYDKGFLWNVTFIKLLSVVQDSLERWLNIDLTTWLVKRQIMKHKLNNISARLAANDDVDVYIMGHTHIPEAVIWVQPNERIQTYVNSGDWVTHQTYVSIIDGKVRLREYEHNPKQLLTNQPLEEDLAVDAIQEPTQNIDTQSQSSNSNQQ